MAAVGVGRSGPPATRPRSGVCEAFGGKIVGSSNRRRPAMKEACLPFDPDRKLLSPQALQEWLTKDCRACFIPDMVDRQDLSEVTDRHETEQRGDRPTSKADGAGAAVRLSSGAPSSRRMGACSKRTSPSGSWWRITRRTSVLSWTFARIACRRGRGCFGKGRCRPTRLGWCSWDTWR